MKYRTSRRSRHRQYLIEGARDILRTAVLAALLFAVALAGTWTLGARALGALVPVEKEVSPVVCTTWNTVVQVRDGIGPVGSFEWCAKYGREGEL